MSVLTGFISHSSEGRGRLRSKELSRLIPPKRVDSWFEIGIYILYPHLVKEGGVAFVSFSSSWCSTIRTSSSPNHLLKNQLPIPSLLEWGLQHLKWRKDNPPTAASLISLRRIVEGLGKAPSADRHWKHLEKRQPMKLILQAMLLFHQEDMNSPRTHSREECLLCLLLPLTQEAPWDGVLSLLPSEPRLYCKHMEAPFLEVGASLGISPNCYFLSYLI